MKSPFSPMSPRGGREGTLGQKREEEEEALTTFIFPSFFLLLFPGGRNNGGFFLSSSAMKVLLIPGQVANFPSSFFPKGLYNANNFSDPNDFEFFLSWKDNQKWL